MTITVAIDNDVKSWMKKKGSIITISRMDIKVGCIGYEDVDVSYKAPAQQPISVYSSLQH